MLEFCFMVFRIDLSRLKRPTCRHRVRVYSVALPLPVATTILFEQKAYSVAKIEFPEVLDEATHKAKTGGLMDPKMGTIDRNFKCQTCGEGMSECPGHFGHIELARPVFHPGYLVKVKKILECICVNCGKLKADTVSATFSSSRFAPYTPIFWGLSPNPMENPNPVPLRRSRQSRRSSSVLWEAVADLRVVVASIAHFTGWLDRRLRVKWGAERGVRETQDDAAVTCCVCRLLDVKSLKIALSQRLGSHLVVNIMYRC